MRLYQEKPGIISEKAIWVFVDYPYMYEAESLNDLLTIISKEWRLNKHFVGAY